MEHVLMNDLSSKATPGEARFARLWKNVQEEYKDDFELRLYFEPNGSQKYPDFALYSSHHGLIFFEVKDHTINQVEEFDHRQCSLHYDDDLKILKFTRDVAIEFINEFKQMNQNIPVSELYVFPNIQEKDLQNKFRFDTSVTSNPFIYGNDFYDYDRLLDKLEAHKKFVYKETARSQEIAISRIQRKLPPSVMEKGKDALITPTLFDGIKKDVKEEKALFLLSKKQEHTLRKFMNHQGYRFLKGHAGTGKTVLIIARAQFLAETFPNAKILITYYTSQLDGVFYHLEQKFPKQITAQRIVRFCNRYIRTETGIADWDNYIKQCLNDIKNKDHEFRENFDFILVDEGQDFKPELGEIIGLLAKGKDYKEKNILIAYDDFQALTNKDKVDTRLTFRGKQRGRVKVLDDSFRTPKEIAIRAEKLIGEKIESVRSVPNAFIYRKLPLESSVADSIDQFINRIRNYDSTLELKDFAIIYPHLKNLHKKVEEEIKNLKKPFQKYSTKSGRLMKMDSNSVKLLTSTYCKGLDFKIVFLIHFDELTEEGQELANKKANEHLYVSLTRALNHVILFSKKESLLLNKILDEKDILVQ
ncbi:MAG: hypothetical protein ACQEWG_06220 [Bacteroidota bacterium]